MLTFHSIDPVAIHLGPLAIHWYGIMYLIGFAACWYVLHRRIAKTPTSGFTEAQLSDLLFYVVLGLILGGRLGYMFFYDWDNVIHDPFQILKIWQGGMSFHGGLIGAIIAMAFFARKHKKSLLDVGDFAAPSIPLGLAAGRIGNFINGELWGRVTDVPWSMVFPGAGNLPRHPSQIYEFLLEGVILFIVLWVYSQKPRPRGAVSGLFLVLYSVFRITVEFFREPDPQIGYLAFGWLTKGQLLSLPMFIVGISLMIWAYRGKKICAHI